MCPWSESVAASFMFVACEQELATMCHPNDYSLHAFLMLPRMQDDGALDGIVLLYNLYVSLLLTSYQY